MDKAVRVLKLPAALLDRAEAEERLPPGAGLMIATAAALLLYALLIAAVA